MHKGKLFVISGPSGSGKTTIVKKVVSLLSDVQFSVSCTTRSKRYDEIEGSDYIYISEGKFRDMVANGEFLEWAEVYGNLYGTPISDITEANATGKDVIMDIDVKGAAQVKKNYSSSVSIFIVPSSMDELRNRLLKRKNESDINIEKRLKTAREEVARIGNYDYIIINEDIDESADSLISIIKAERLKREVVIDYVYKHFDVFGREE